MELFYSFLNNIFAILAVAIIHGFILKRMKENSVLARVVSGIIFSFAILAIMSNKFVLSPGVVFNALSRNKYLRNVCRTNRRIHNKHYGNHSQNTYRGRRNDYGDICNNILGSNRTAVLLFKKVKTAINETSLALYVRFYCAYQYVVLGNYPAERTNNERLLRQLLFPY